MNVLIGQLIKCCRFSSKLVFVLFWVDIFTSGYSIDDAVDRVTDVLSGCDQQAGSDKDEDGGFVVKTEHVIVDPHLVQVREPTNLTEEPQHDVALAGSSVEASKTLREFLYWSFWKQTKDETEETSLHFHSQANSERERHAD